MDAIECIYTRRSIRKFKDKAVPWDDVVKILDAGRLAPCAGNIQNWQFIITRDDDNKNAVADACLQQDWMKDASVHIIICSEPVKVKRFYGIRGERLYSIQNCAAAVENMLLAAHALGLGACWVSAFNDEKLKEVLGMPEEAYPQAVIAIGYADEAPDMPPKNRLEIITGIERWRAKKKAPGESSMGWWSARIEKGIKDTAKQIKKIKQKLKKPN